MIINVIGPPGAGKTYFIKNILKQDPPYNKYGHQISEELFNWFKENNLFEHTGLNGKINSYLKDKKHLTILIKSNILRCLYNILKDNSDRSKLDRVKVLLFYFRNKPCKSGILIVVPSHDKKYVY